MALRIDDVLQRWLGHRPTIAKLVKYGAASAAGIVTSQPVLIGLLILDLRAITANIIAVTIGSIPNYLINRACTFEKRGTHSFTREVLPFWLMAVLGLVVSTIAVAWVDGRVNDNVLLISATSIGAFGVLWIAKFFVLDRVLFAPLASAVEAETSRT